MNPFMGRLSFSLPAIGFRRFRLVTSQTVASTEEGDSSGSAILAEENGSLFVFNEIEPSLLSLLLLLVLARLAFSFTKDFHSLTNFAVLELAPPWSLLPLLLLAEKVNVIVSMEVDDDAADVIAEERSDVRVDDDDDALVVDDETDVEEDEGSGGGGGRSFGAVKVLADEDDSVFCNETRKNKNL